MTSGVADVRQVLKEAQDRRLRYGRATYLLLDECHRWSKAQSDSILPAIESGLIRFIGSTTENPMVSMTPAIVSRCRVFQFEPLQTQDVLRVLQNALRDPERGYGGSDVRAEDGALAYIARMSGGDVRTALGALELAWLTTAGETDPSTGRPFKRLTLETAQESVQKPLLKMDEGQYYDMLSAFIKSMRGSDRTRRSSGSAACSMRAWTPGSSCGASWCTPSEDVGLADPLAMLQAQAAVTALEFVGMPEARIPIAQAIIAVCLAEKSNSVCMAIDAAMADAQKGGLAPVPPYLRDQSYATPHARTPQYKYPHDYPGHFVKQAYMPPGYEHTVYYRPTGQGHEAKLRDRHARRFGEGHEA